MRSNSMPLCVMCTPFRLSISSRLLPRLICSDIGMIGFIRDRCVESPIAASFRGPRQSTIKYLRNKPSFSIAGFDMQTARKLEQTLGICENLPGRRHRTKVRAFVSFQVEISISLTTYENEMHVGNDADPVTRKRPQKPRNGQQRVQIVHRLTHFGGDGASTDAAFVMLVEVESTDAPRDA